MMMDMMELAAVVEMMMVRKMMVRKTIELTAVVEMMMMMKMMVRKTMAGNSPSSLGWR